MIVVSILSCVLALLVLPALLYLGVLTLLSVPTRAPVPSKLSRFVVVVPAHNEEAQIATTVQSLKAVDYPPELFEVLVVADNCTDATAAIAQAAGARVLERKNDKLRGKGYALEHAFDSILADTAVDAAVVVDADTVVSRSLLKAFSARLELGYLAVQAEYGVRNPDASWRTRLMAVALGMFHRLRSLGRERLQVSAGLRGNGMCFATRLLREHPHKAFGLVEDVEYGIAIGLQGVRIAYADEAQVYGEMVSSAAASQTQRQRWEGGRMQLVREKLPRLVGRAIAERNLMLFDLAMDLAIPPLSYLGLSVALGALLEAIVWFFHAPQVGGGVFWLINAVCLLAYVFRGAQLSRLGFKAALALLYAPIYVIWKIVLMLKPGGKNQAWIRTRRENEHV